jgi:hypothetical protein
MIHWPCVGIRYQILLADISNVAAVGVFSEQMVKGLILARPDMFWNRLIPILTVGKNGIDVEHDTAEIEQPVADDIADGELGFGTDRGNGIRIHSPLSPRKLCLSTLRLANGNSSVKGRALSDGHTLLGVDQSPIDVRTDAGVVERGGLENRCASNGTQGSNPCLSANFY